MCAQCIIVVNCPYRVFSSVIYIYKGQESHGTIIVLEYSNDFHFFVKVKKKVCTIIVKIISTSALLQRVGTIIVLEYSKVFEK
jgi:hypothetical protein